MRIQISKKTDIRVTSRLRRRARIRKTIIGTPEIPRLAVFRSHQHIYVQAIDDQNKKTLAQASSLKIKEKIKPREKAAKIGAEIAEKLLKSKIKKIAFDRGGYIYHGRVKAVGEAAREAGLEF